LTDWISQPRPASHRVKIFRGGLAQSVSTLRVSAAASILILALLGCAAHKKPQAVIPLRCLHELTVTDFADKCVEIGPNQAVCNKVKIRFACVSYPPGT